jgi:hypothetical protein
MFSEYNNALYQKFMLSKTLKDESAPAQTVVSYTEIIDEEIKAPPAIEEMVEFYQPKQNDTLFWCLYIIHYGMKDYNNIKFNYGVKELEEKQRLSAFIRENAARIKNTNYKVTNVLIQEILSELLTSQKETSLSVLGAFTVFYDINLLIVDANDRCMLEFWANKEKDSSLNIYVLRKDKYGKYSVQLEWIAPSRVLEMREKYLVLDTYMRPLKAASNYKVEELVELAKRLSIYDDNKKYKKSDLYESIQDLCRWK